MDGHCICLPLNPKVVIFHDYAILSDFWEFQKHHLPLESCKRLEKIKTDLFIFI